MRHVLFALSALVLSSIGCSSSNGGRGNEAVGTVRAALSTEGPDGAVYSLPSSVGISMLGSTLGNACTLVSGTATQTFTLPPGEWTFYLDPSGCFAADPGDAGTNVPFTLDVTGDDGGMTTQSALLVNPTQTVNVVAGSTVSLVFDFTTANVGNLVMGSGSVATSIAVEAGAPTSAASGGVSVALTSPTVTGTLAALDNPPASITTDLRMFGLSAFSPNAQGEACATFSPALDFDVFSIPPRAYFDLQSELVATGATGTLCFADSSGTFFPANSVYVTVTRNGAPTTDTFQSALAPDGGVAPEATFSLVLVGTTTSPVYSDTELALAQFQQPVAFTGVSGQLEVASESQGTLATVAGGLGAPTLTLSPTP
jgi:hypothetical protein